jgi:formylglycine-generating enzyme required for sulfatase activity
MPLLPGEVLNKRYRIVSLLGEGAFGAVYRAWDTADGRGVAIKEYLDSSPQTQRLFRAEAMRLSALSHPQLPAVRDHFCLDEVGQYLISEFVDGVDLRDLLDQYGPLPSDLVVSWLQAAARPLSYLHGKKQLHLNIKPANLRLTPAGELFLVDSGLPGLGITLGASGYAAPEQQVQGTVSQASDLYGLGATLYTLLTGRVPPDALRRESGLEVLTPAREVNPDVEPYLSVVASRAMDLSPEVRYQSADEFAAALERPTGRQPFAGREPRRTPAALGPAAPPRLPRSRRRQIEQRTILGLSGLLLLVVGVLAGLTWAARSPAVQQEQVAATATLRSRIIAALTAITTVTPTPAPSQTPIPTPEPLVDAATGARQIYISGGLFRMGSDDLEPDEAPSHMIRLDAYFIDETEVTNGAYQACVAAGACQPPDRPGATYHRSYYGDASFDNYPVIFVSWYDARDFCDWREGRLPTEAEWERAAGFDPLEALKYTFPWGDAFDGTRLNFCDVSCGDEDRNVAFNDEHRDTAPVGSFPGGQSPTGLFDMAGNVMEWVNDWYDARYYRTSADTNPLGPITGEFKVIRGGSWLSSQEDVRTSSRTSFDPQVSRANLGFRCAMTAP